MSRTTFLSFAMMSVVTELAASAPDTPGAADVAHAGPTGEPAVLLVLGTVLIVLAVAARWRGRARSKRQDDAPAVLTATPPTGTTFVPGPRA